MFGLQQYVGRCLSSQTFVFSSVAAFVSYGSVRTAIFIQCLDCLNVDKGVYNLNVIRLAGQLCYFVLHACQLF